MLSEIGVDGNERFTSIGLMVCEQIVVSTQGTSADEPILVQLFLVILVDTKMARLQGEFGSCTIDLLCGVH